MLKALRTPFPLPNLWKRRSHERAAPEDLWARVLRAVGDLASDVGVGREGPEESDLVRKVAARNGAAAEELYRRFSPRVYRFIFRRLDGCAEDAEEITLDTFLSAVELAPTYSGNSSVFVWLCGIARLRIIDSIRRRTRASRIPADRLSSIEDLERHATDSRSHTAAEVEQILDRLGAAQVMEAALARLNEDEREALLLRYVEGFSTREIAEVMRRSERAVESLILRAKAKPRDFLARALGDGGTS